MNENVKDLNYLVYSVDKTLVAKIVVYNENVEYISSLFNQNSSDNLLKTIVNDLGKLTEVIYNEILEETINLGAYQILMNEVPQYIRKKTGSGGSPNEVIYPQRLVWNKNKVLYELEIDPLNNNINYTLHIISKKALKDRVIFGFHNPKKNLILSKYIN